MTIQQEEIEYEPLPDYYATLNVSPTAKLQEIKKSFRKLAMQFHPDKNKEEGAQERFQELSEAYAILSDAEKRREYDELYMDDEIQESFDDNDSGDSDSTSEEFGTGDNGSSSKSADEEFVPFEDDSEEGDEDLWADLDDETLFKVLKFLADNEYEISKKTTRVVDEPRYSERQTADQFAGYTTRSSERHSRFEGTQQGHETPSYKWSRDAQHDFHGHAYSHGHAHSSGHTHRSHASRPSHTFESHGFCQTSIRWEGNVKITSRSCY